METILITNDPRRARVAEMSGVDRIMVDLELLRKAERQGHLDTVISGHSLRDVECLRSTLSTSRLMVRVNPMHEGSADEISAVIAAGAEIIMLPMFHYANEVADFVDIVGGRAKTCLLFETGGALANIRDVLNVDGIGEAHIGLNDLHLSLGLKFMFEPLSDGLVDYMAGMFREYGMQFGIGGVARIDHGLVPAHLVLSEHVRLGSSKVILSRDYSKIFDEFSGDDSLKAFQEEMRKLQQNLEHLHGLSYDDLASNSEKFKEVVSRIVRARLGTSRPGRVVMETQAERRS